MIITLILITYDVNTKTESGKKRLLRVAKQCLNYGQRVQNSVFECKLDATQFCQARYILEGIIDKSKDSLRYYILGNNYKDKVIHVGAKETYDVDGLLIF